MTEKSQWQKTGFNQRITEIKPEIFENSTKISLSKFRHWLLKINDGNNWKMTGKSTEWVSSMASFPNYLQKANKAPDAWSQHETTQ